MSDDYENKEEEEPKEEKEEKTEEEEEELPALTLQDIELLMKNTEVWDELIAGKITIEQAKKLFEENYEELANSQKKKTARKKTTKSKKTKVKEEEEE
ncbi:MULTISPECIES: RNA polymerase subunit Rpo13 [Acidianus]|jgi:hypothetical protein|uniref:RNA polymerase Rpo13 n=2 Tax=Acidianus TaxID=12914 RepID=A0A650CXC6_ACIAM|nr:MULTISPECIES: RNA polymerase subunit Rpo13 [Acidianus]AEE93617.1 hypothetical protein Ahos_0730 [Acidianus hospitalis W1]MDT7901091.1 RNA polymerase subunit Rpo13 [Acidianus sp.]MQL54723.1 RNA polymerase Rpo13 [Acidianus ambivalens]QGR22519.1 RNA polymerase Rpo13 [Acidianus ambivalens]